MIRKWNCLFVLLLMIGTSCIAGILKNQLNNHDHFHQLTRRYSPMDLDCNVLQGDIYICPNQVDGSGVISSDAAPAIATCNYVDFYANVVNISSTNDACLSYHYSGNLTATVVPDPEYDSNIFTRDDMTANHFPNDVYNYSMNADINLCQLDLSVNLTLCNNGSCVVYDPDGIYNVADRNSTCTHDVFALIIHSINKTNSYI